jgi:hypothetical protein
MSKTCTFTGTKSNIPDYNLGSLKKVAAKVDIIINKEKKTEKITNPKWTIGLKNQSEGVVKDYKIETKKGEVTVLSQADLEQNPVLFKLWKNKSDAKFISCEGMSSLGKVISNGNITVKNNVSGVFADSEIYSSAVYENLDGTSPEYNREFYSSFKLKFSHLNQGTLGVLHLVKSKITQIDSSNKETIIVDTEGEFVLYPDKTNTPLHNQVMVNHVFIKALTNDEPYEFSLELFQPIDHQHRYKFEETFRSYLFFKGNNDGDIWHPVSFENELSLSPSYMECKVNCSIKYNSAEDTWDFSGDEDDSSPSFHVIKELPEWNKTFHDCIKTKVPLLKAKVMKSIVTEHNVDDLIGICNLAPDAPEMNLPLKEKIKFVNAVVTSIAAKKAYFRNLYFSNVENSTKDPRVGGYPWRNLWETIANQGNHAQYCTSHDFPPTKFPGELHDCQTKRSQFFGGHIVKGRKSKQVAAGDSKSVFIFPICIRHNNKDHIYMKTTRYKYAILLLNYFQ